MSLLLLFLFIKQCFSQAPIDTKSLLIQTQCEFSNTKSEFTCILGFNEINGQPVSNTYVTIYETKSPNVLYNFPILITNEHGIVQFTSKRDHVDIVFSKDTVFNENNPNNYAGMATISLSINASIVKKVNFSKLTFELQNFKKIPEMKVELTPFRGYWGYSQQSGSYKSEDLSKRYLYLSPGLYNFNLDTLEFFDDNPESFVLAFKNIKIEENIKEYYLKADRNQLANYKIALNDTNLGWFKIISTATGDYQSMYLGKPTNVYSNTTDMQLKMFYIPNKKCIKFFKTNTQLSNSQIIFNCDDTNTRYDMYSSEKNKPLSTKFINYISKPDRIAIKKSPNGSQVSFKNKEGLGFSAMYFHKIWDMQIKPKFKSGIVTMPLDTWNSTILKIKPKMSIPAFTKTTKINPDTLKDNYDSWTDLYADSKPLSNQSQQFLDTWPSFSKINFEPEVVKLESFKKIATCDDLLGAEIYKTYLIEINYDQAHDVKKHPEFTKCLRDFSKNNSNKVFILKNNFIHHTFDTLKHTILYHFYLALHQNNNFVGIDADKFYDLVYGFQDFSYICVDNYSYITKSVKLLKKIIPDWLSEYKSFTPSPIFYHCF